MLIRIFTLLTLLDTSVLYAQPMVHEESLHHVEFENDHIRLLKIIALPGDSSLVHKHPYNYFYITLKGSRIWNKRQGTDGSLVTLPTGFHGGYYTTAMEPMIHRFANVGGDTLIMLAIENKSELGSENGSLYKSEQGEELIVENHFFRVLKFELKNKDRKQLAYLFPTLVFNNEGQNLNFHNGKKITNLDKIYLLEPYSAGYVENNSGLDTSLIIVQVKK